jgi:tetratricopeptide (TPR) repeat protein
MYLPSLGVCMIVSFIFNHTIHTLSSPSPSLQSYSRRVLPAYAARALAVAVIAAFSVLCFQRTHDWRDNLSLFKGDVERVVPNSVRLLRNLGTMHWEAGEWKAAASHFRRALVYWPDHSETHGDLAYAMDQGDVNASGVVQEYQAALQSKPDKYEYHNRLAFAWLKAGQASHAMEEFLWCLVWNPKNGSEMAGNIANLNMYRREFTTSLRWFQLSLRLDPTDANTRFNLAVMAVQELKDANGRVHPRFGPFGLIQLDISRALDPLDEAAKVGIWKLISVSISRLFQGFSQQLGKALSAHPSLVQTYARYKRAGYIEAALEAKEAFERRHGPTVKSKAAETVKPGK